MTTQDFTAPEPDWIYVSVEQGKGFAVWYYPDGRVIVTTTEVGILSVAQCAPPDLGALNELP